MTVPRFGHPNRKAMHVQYHRYFQRPLHAHCINPYTQVSCLYSLQATVTGPWSLVSHLSFVIGIAINTEKSVSGEELSWLELVLLQ